MKWISRQDYGTNIEKKISKVNNVLFLFWIENILRNIFIPFAKLKDRNISLR